MLDALDRARGSALGAGALAGSTLGLDPAPAATELRLGSVIPNSLDAVSARDFIAEFLAACALCGISLSRIGEEVVLWTSTEFGFARLDDAFATGSSLMPQKKNPDVAELVRGKAGRLIGNLTGLLTMLKGLPLSYNRDLQEDKEPLFDSVRTLSLALPAVAGMMRGLTFDPDRMRAALDQGGALATDLADALVRAGVPFREAHEVVGSLTAAAGDRSLASLTDEEVQAVSASLDPDLIRGLSVDASIAARRAPGPSPDSVRAQLSELTDRATILRSRARGLIDAIGD